MDVKRGLVTVCSGGVKALSEPVFVLKHNDKFYVTLAVLEYDPAAVKNAEQRRGVAEISEAFGRAEPDPCLDAKPIKALSFKPQATNPTE